MSVSMGDFPVRVTGITADSRHVRPGFAFVAIRGTNLDGNDFIDDAIGRGASLIVSESPPPNLPVPAVTVQDARRAISRYAAEFYDYPARSMQVIGVTGTNGKTTAACLLHAALAADRPAGLIGSTETQPPWPGTRSSLTTPDPVELQALLAHMRQEGVQHVVLEATSIGLKQHRTAHVPFAAAIFTNFSLDHLDHHASIDDYRRAKARLFAGLTADQPVFWNVDDPNQSWFRSQTAARPVTYGLHHPDAAFRGVDIKDTHGGLSFTCQATGGEAAGTDKPVTFPIFVPMLGRHNVYNALAAIAAALCFGVPIPTVQEALANFRGVPRRFQLIHDGQVRIIDDFAHNPAGYSELLASVAELPANRRLLLTTVRAARGAQVNEANARVLAQALHDGMIDALYVTMAAEGQDAGRTPSDAENGAFLRTLGHAGVPFAFHNQLEPLLARMLDEAAAGDLLVLSGGRAMDPAAELVRQQLGARQPQS